MERKEGVYVVYMGYKETRWLIKGLVLLLYQISTRHVQYLHLMRIGWLIPQINFYIMIDSSNNNSGIYNVSS